MFDTNYNCNLEKIFKQNTTLLCQDKLNCKETYIKKGLFCVKREDFMDTQKNKVVGPLLCR